MMQGLMKALVCLLLCSAAASTTFAAKPKARDEAAIVEIFDRYWESLRARDLGATARLMSPQSVAWFRRTLEPVLLEAQSSGAVLPFQLHPEMSDTEFFAAFMARYLDESPWFVEGLRDSRIRPVGVHFETKDRGFLIYEYRTGTRDLEITKYLVNPFVRSSDGWRLEMAGELKGLAQELRRRAKAEESPTD